MRKFSHPRDRATIMNCVLCQEEIRGTEDLLRCTGNCSDTYHFHCGGFLEDAFRRMKPETKAKWKCVGCKTRRVTPRDQESGPSTLKKDDPKDRPKDVPKDCDQERRHSTLKKDDPKDRNQESDPATLKRDDSKDRQPSYPIPNSAYLEQITSLKSFIKDQFAEYSISLNHNEYLIQKLTESIESLKNEVKSLKEENASLKSENARNKEDLAILKSETLELQQYSRRMNLEISELPEAPNEDTKQLVKSVLVALDVNNFDHATVIHRVPSSRVDKPKPIIVQFSSKAERDKCLVAAKAKRLKASDINSSFDSVPVYLNEHLAPGMKKLLHMCKQFKRDNNFQFCWVRDGKLFLRQKENSRVFKVQKDSDLSNITFSS